MPGGYCFTRAASLCFSWAPSRAHTRRTRPRSLTTESAGNTWRMKRCCVVLVAFEPEGELGIHVVRGILCGTCKSASSARVEQLWKGEFIRRGPLFKSGGPPILIGSDVLGKFYG